MKSVIEMPGGFWNFRGSFKVGPIDIGTHASLVKLKSGDFVFLDCCDFTDEQLHLICELTENGSKVSAVINLHPFHTVFVPSMVERFPDAQFFGTRRHIDRFPDVDWAPVLTENFEETNPFSDDLEFTVPKGVDFISANEKIHFSSVIAFHDFSGTIHSNDTFNIIQLPDQLDAITQPLHVKSQIQFHPTLPFALEKRAGASSDFLEWVDDICEPWFERAENLCAAHAGVYSDEGSGRLAKKLARAKLLIQPVLIPHRLRHG